MIESVALNLCQQYAVAHKKVCRAKGLENRCKCESYEPDYLGDRMGVIPGTPRCENGDEDKENWCNQCKRKERINSIRKHWQLKRRQIRMKIVRLGSKPIEVAPTVKYILCPAEVKSRTDGQYHFITPKQLMGLYMVKPSECETFNGSKEHVEGLRRGILIALHPRYDGNYPLFMENGK